MITFLPLYLYFQLLNDYHRIGQGLVRIDEFRTSSPSLPRSADIPFSSRLVLSRVLVTIDVVLDWIYCTLYTHNTLGLQALQLYRCSTHFQFTVAHALGFSVVSWQRIYHILVVTSIHTWRLLFTAKFLSYHFFSVTFNCHLQNSNSNSSCLRSSLYSLDAGPQKTPSSIVRESVFSSVG
jgi:hypothetical protein